MSLNIHKHKPTVLYISYDGMTDPLGQSQVLPYIKKLSESGITFHLISFEKELLFKKNKKIIQESIGKHAITWHPLTYTKKPPVLSTLFDLAKGWSKIKKLHTQIHFNLVHCRGYIAALLGLRLKKQFNIRFIFDMRGWWVDEKKESGLWNGAIYNPIYNYFKNKETDFFTHSDVAISLTYAGKDEIEKKFHKRSDQIAIIPTCVDFNIFKHFNPETRKELRSRFNVSEEAFVWVYSGSMGGNYNNAAIFKLFTTFSKLKPGSFLLLLTPTPENQIKTELALTNINPASVIIINSPFTQVNEYLSMADAGMIFYEKTYSSIGRSPTKLGEYWAMGLPFVSLKGIGDLDLILKTYPNSGHLMEDLSETSYNQAADFFINRAFDRELLRKNAYDYFALEKGSERYLQLYNKLI